MARLPSAPLIQSVAALFFTSAVLAFAAIAHAGEANARYRVVSAEEVPLSAPSALAVSADGRLIAVGSLEGSVHVWDWRQAKMISSLTVEDEIIESLLFTDNDQRLAISYALEFVGAHLFLWEMATGAVADVGELQGQGIGYPVPNGTIGFENGDGIAFIDQRGAFTNRQIEFQQELSSPALSPDGLLIAGSGFIRYYGHLVLLNDKGKLLRAVDIGYDLMDAVFSPDSRIVAVMQQEDGGLSDPAKFNPETNNYDLFDASTGNRIRRFGGHDRFLSGACFSPDGSRFLTWSGDKTLILWDTGTGESIQRFVGHSDGVSDAKFLAGGTIIASASMDGSVKLWAPDTGREIVSLHAPIEQTTPPSFLAITPDGRFVEGGGVRMSIVRVVEGQDGPVLSDEERAALKLASLQTGDAAE